MRTNLPVTSVEYLLRDGESIVSRTDLRGKITYVNPYFVEVSGFSEQELLGAPQNIVRHPDMPPEAFADMWRTLHAGMQWTGVVKNRRKNGDFYWVLANVTPVKENGRVAGYMSVRSKPGREQVQAAEALYRRIREGQAAGIELRHGKAVRTGLANRLRALRNMPLAVRLGIHLGGGALLLLALGAAVLPSSAWAAAAALAGAALVLQFWYSLHRTVVVPLKEATAVARAIASGDLSSGFAATRHDEAGRLLRALQQMNINLVATIGDVRRNVDSILVSVQGIARGNMDLAGRTETQAASLEASASSVEQFASAVQQNADSAEHADRCAASASSVAAKGGAVVAKVGATMNDISESARRIEDIIGLIDGIAFQTNILALNAAVEAARAGEQGRGFAVVAAEVRQLAQRSAGAATDIKRLITGSVSKVESGSSLVAEAVATMDDIVGSVRQVTALMGEIRLASGEQSAGVSQISDAISRMDKITQQNAALVKEAAGAAAGLEEQAVRLSQAVSLFGLPAADARR
ncbi:methyl-accepting chemotaxis protein [Noviherbaspirillum autotrophicum]|uniref:Chemotaxis protein n=1 Tax=Noviherbaspirillum autotrophicum TaxID=709839 RepID=A0A0C1YI78_9BURK|nr:PAS domain-containing methyl-accepting chemotaxis protein [Noviherbaspirillum autotrophicum]KIF80242.1 chemotaxis protein [Noviherbaspirillum autotrophicum]